MERKQSISENFDDLVRMAQNDPEAFESYRDQLIQKTIENAPFDRQTNLRRYQWRIDQERQRQNSSFNACIKLTRMMNQRLLSISNQLLVLTELTKMDSSNRQNFIKDKLKALEQA
ncbi:MAG: DUF3135 domain-containing protein [Gammaproteobacteria bacterium]|jgi:hypothetical protein